MHPRCGWRETKGPRISIRERLKYRIRSVLIEFDADLRPKVIGKVIQLPTGGDRHEERLRLLVDREFGDPGSVWDHLDRSTEIEGADDDGATPCIPSEQAAT